MSEKTLKFGNAEVYKKKKKKKKKIASKKQIALSLVDINKVVISDKFKQNDKGSKYFICYKNDDIFRPF